MAVKLDERIATLQTKLAQLNVRQQRAEARQRSLLSKRERAAVARQGAHA